MQQPRDLGPPSSPSAAAKDQGILGSFFDSKKIRFFLSFQSGSQLFGLPRERMTQGGTIGWNKIREKKPLDRLPSASSFGLAGQEAIPIHRKMACEWGFNLSLKASLFWVIKRGKVALHGLFCHFRYTFDYNLIGLISRFINPQHVLFFGDALATSI